MLRWSKIVFVLLAKGVAVYIFFTLIIVKKLCFKGMFIRIFYSCGSSFYYCINYIVYLLIYINSWLGSKACKSCYWYIEKPWGQNLGASKLVWVFEEMWRQPKQGWANEFGNTTLDPIKTFASSKSHEKGKKRKCF